MMNGCQKEKSGLIIHSGAIGDCLLTLPLAAAIKNEFSLDRMDFIGPSEYIDFYPGRTCIEGIRSIDSVPLYRFFEEDLIFTRDDNDRLSQVLADYEQIISFLGEGDPQFEKNLIYAVHSTHSAEVTVLPAKPDPAYPDHITAFYREKFTAEHQLDNLPDADDTFVHPLPDDYLAGEELLQQAGMDPDQTIVIIQPGSGSPDKCWHWHNFILLAAELEANDIQPVFLLGPAEQARFPKQAIKAMTSFCVMENLSLTQVLQILTQADALLGNDSGIGHLAAAMGKKTLILFGPSNPTHYAPRGPHVVIEQIPEDALTTPDTPRRTKITTRLLQWL